jgi:hypothetical protein
MQTMMGDYKAYVKKNNVIEVPPDYNVINQAQANAAEKN